MAPKRKRSARSTPRGQVRRPTPKTAAPDDPGPSASPAPDSQGGEIDRPLSSAERATKRREEIGHE